MTVLCQSWWPLSRYSMAWKRHSSRPWFLAAVVMVTAPQRVRTGILIPVASQKPSADTIGPWQR